MTESTHLSLALIGMGSAGRSRERACAEVEGIRLAARVSRREGVGDRDLEETLQDPKIEAIAVSTENTSHADLVRRGLEAGKHVLCDYPLALNGPEARELFALAKRTNRVLHVEHIALLSSEHQQLKSEALQAGALLKGEYLFQGGWNAKLADINISGPPRFLTVSRLLQIADLFGAFRIASAREELDAAGYALHLHLAFSHGGLMGFTEERRDGLPRRRSLIANCERGPLTLKAGTMGGGLFAKDLAWFRDRVAAGKPAYYDESLMLGILDQLHSMP